METIKLCDIKPADYNPRKITEEGFENLKASLKELGVIKPVLVNAENNVLIAGHQRTKAMLEIGITECMAFILKGVSKHDECRFNQWHNKCEYETSDLAPRLRINKELDYGINEVDPKDIEVLDVGKLAALNHHLSMLLIKYGEYGLPICYKNGMVAISSAYALASRNCNMKMHVLVLEDEKVKRAVYYMSKDYGKFCYDGIKRETFIQSFAQMKRLRPSEKRVFHSRLYENLVIPYLQKNNCADMRIIDFGAGEYDYAVRMKKAGYNIHPVDPYHKKDGAKIYVGQNRKHFLKVCDDLDKYGQYDVVICDSVLNSVDNMQSWMDVIYTCSALLKPNGHLFISGRPNMPLCHFGRQRNKVSGVIETLYFLDEDGLTANYRDGAWFFQKFDSDEQLETLVNVFTDNGAMERYKYSNGYGIHLVKTKTLPLDVVLPSVMREWDMPLPNGLSYKLHEQIKQSITKIYDNENR